MVMETSRVRKNVGILLLYLTLAGISLTRCDADADRSMRLLRGPKHTRNTINKSPKKLKTVNHLDVNPTIFSSNVEPYSLSSPFSLPPYDSLAPIPLPENSPPFCVFPPPSTPTTIPTPTGFQPSTPSPPDYSTSPLLPTPPSPMTITPSPPGDTFPTPTPEIVPGPPGATFPTPTPEIVPGPPGDIFPTPTPEIVPGPPEDTFPTPTPEIVPSPPTITPGSPEPVLNPPIIIPGPPYSEPSPPFIIPSPTGGTTPGPPSTVPSPTEGTVPSPYVFQPPVVYPPPSVPPPPNYAPRTTLWCVAKPSVPDPITQEAMNYACWSGADCTSIQPNGPCFKPDTVFAHASYAFNSYWQRTKEAGGNCEFGGTAMLVAVDPSYDGCHFVSN